MQFVPRDYQEYCIDKLIHTPRAGLLLEMGLGKTISTLSAINDLMFDYFSIARVLIVAPLRVAQHTWTAEIEKWDHLNFKVSKILGTKKQREAALQEEADIYIINRENLIWLLEHYGDYMNKKKKQGFYIKEKWPFDVLVLDELSTFKSSSAKRHKLLKKAIPHINRVIGLTGTPAPNGLEDLWAQIYLLDGGQRLERTKTKYRERYFRPASYIKNSHGNLIPTKYEIVEGGEEAIYTKISDICVSMKSVDHLKLPETFQKDIVLEMDPETQKNYKHLAKEYVLELPPDRTLDAKSSALLQSQLHQLAQGAVYDDDKNVIELHEKKLDALEELIEEANGHSVMVFYWFKHDLERLKNRFPKGQALTDKNIDRWNQGKIQLLFVHPASAGHGLNLQDGGHIIVWYCLTWSLELYQQANARLNRQGQKFPVTINRIVMKGTTDEQIVEVLEGKRQVQDALMEAVKAII